MAFEWTLLASFQAEWERFHRLNDLVQLTVEVARLRLENARLRIQLGLGTEQDLLDADGDGIPDVFQRQVNEPLVVAPDQLLPVVQIVQYNPDAHKRLYEQGYQDAQRAWAHHYQA